MSWSAPSRNLESVEFAALRRAVETPFHRAHDELTAAYYDGWRHGRSAPWRGYDVQATPEQSRALFDELHGLIDCLRMLALDARNTATDDRDAKFAAVMAESGEGGRSRRERLRAHVSACRARGPDLEVG